ncbi:hypothetical protein C7999DRAFT_27746 [Corynascus novoguineensis]|uniref:Uncharacterized protein n=1 Tax=Corynascus novoguineensis TaxID=1126955 RepID=A0AAN7D0C6_9PEZI|nr:hypothetical protein C7999DRAFT_27746 [Corynascus novoguineensis]
MATCTFINYALYYKLGDSEKDKTVEGLGRTLSQTRHLCGSIEQDPDGDHSLVRKKGDSVELHHMRYGDDNPDAHPHTRLAVMALKASFAGLAGFIHQLAANYRANLTDSPYPSWDTTCLDLSALDKPPQQQQQQQQEQLPSINTTSPSVKISTYDAAMAAIWRGLTHTRHPHYASRIFTSPPS